MSLPQWTVFHSCLLFFLFCQIPLVTFASNKQVYKYTTDPCDATFGEKPVIFLDEKAKYLAGSCQQLSPEVVLAWTLGDSSIKLEVHALTKGWVAVGVNRVASMLGADVAVGWVNDSSIGHLIDAKNDDTVRQVPTADDFQNLRLLKSRETDSITSLLFSRPLVSPDKLDRDIKGRVWIIWAYGTKDPMDDDIKNLQFHERDGATSIRFNDEDTEMMKEEL